MYRLVKSNGEVLYRGTKQECIEFHDKYCAKLPCRLEKLTENGWEYENPFT